jgi:glyoxalase family protein
MTEPSVLGLHHITAITADAQKNIDFYTTVLGLKFTKLTVNFDDPSSYHLYFGDRLGSPGTALTFFAWPGGSRGRQGVNQAMTISFSVPEASMSFWIERLTRFAVPFEKNKEQKFNDNYLSFKDPDGLILELVADNKTQNPKIFSGYGVPAEHAIRGFYSVTLWEDGFESTDHFLKDVLGFQFVGQDENTFRYRVPNGTIGTFIDVRSAPDFWTGEMGTGIIHHVAFRTANDETQQAWHEKLSNNNTDVTHIIDRQYFHSIYFHEPGGVLFEIATDGPGFTINESEEKLGTSLQLPPMYEPHRKEIENVLPKVVLPRNE